MNLELIGLLQEAETTGASDIHLLEGLNPVLRIDGRLTTMTNHDKLTRAKLSEMVQSSIPERLKDFFKEKGHADYSTGHYRFNAYRQRGSDALSIRLIKREISPPSRLGIPRVIQNLAASQSGLILVTGPTGSGKSTTLASLIDHINQTQNKHIITLEDPIEFVHNNNRCIISQREIGTDVSNYADGLTAALREDPDIILVGEMRDPDTFATALTAAETGHLVLATTHTLGAAATVDRIVDAFPSGQQNQIRTQIAETIVAFISQRLVPTSSGRTAAFEIMTGTTAVKTNIRDNKIHQLQAIIESSAQDGMQSLNQHLDELCISGIITQETAKAWRIGI